GCQELVFGGALGAGELLNRHFDVGLLFHEVVENTLNDLDLRLGVPHREDKILSRQLGGGRRSRGRRDRRRGSRRNSWSGRWRGGCRHIWRRGWRGRGLRRGRRKNVGRPGR